MVMDSRRAGSCLAMAALSLAVWLPASVPTHDIDSPLPAHRAFRIFLPKWLPTGFRQSYDPIPAQYPAAGARRFFTRRYGAHGRWVGIFEGPAGCCLDTVRFHWVGRTMLSGGRVAYLSDQGRAYGGLLLFWDQGHTYIAMNTPNLSRKTLLHIATSTVPTPLMHRDSDGTAPVAL